MQRQVDAGIDRVIAGTFFPEFAGEAPAAYWAAVEAHVAQLRRSGATHVMVNAAPVSILQVMDPENSYLRFTTYGHTPDKYVTSTFNEGIFHPSILELNRRHLLWQAGLAQQYGFRCCVRCVEMTMMPESFFQRWPALRGPRVDNPACSTSPRYAMCAMVPEVQDHYRQLVTKLLQLCPQIDEMHIFTNDSGGGFCYSDHLYSGANGPVHCKHTPCGKQAQTFCRVVLEAGQAINPDFRVVMTSGLMPNERVDFLDGMPAGLAASIYGAFAWGGGLEDRWANMCVGPAIHEPAVRAAARAWQMADMQARADQIRGRGGLVYACYNPDYYTGPSDAPRPYETHESMMRYREMGVTSVIGGAPGGEYHANGGIFVQALQDGAMGTDAAVRTLAAAWVGEALAPSLCEVWRLSERADREWPMPARVGHALYCQALLMSGPIVPDAARLGEHDLDYFLTPVQRDEQKMQSHHGGPWRYLNHTNADRLYICRQLETVVLPADDEALAQLNDMLRDPALTDAQRRCLGVQRREIGIHRCCMARILHWFQASFHVLAGSTPDAGLPTLAAIIRNEIANSQAWHAYQGGDGLLDDDRQRLMRAHADDAVRVVDLREFKPHEYEGLAGHRGAHQT